MDAIETFKKAVCSNIELESIGIHEYLVHTGFSFADGDEFRIVLKTNGEKWVLTDEGHTMMWLSYEDYSLTETRMDILDQIVFANSVTYDEGRISVEFTPNLSGPALQSIIQAIGQVADLRFMNRDNVVSTFIEDMKERVKSSKLGDKCEFDKEITTKTGIYKPDIYIDSSNPILVFGITSTSNCKDAIIDMMELQQEEINYRFIAIFDNIDKITTKYKVRAVNLSDKSIMGLEDISVSMDRFSEVMT